MLGSGGKGGGARVQRKNDGCTSVFEHAGGRKTSNGANAGWLLRVRRDADVGVGVQDTHENVPVYVDRDRDRQTDG